MKYKKAFSLIELMISLITISCIVAAFTPVITKKMKNSNVTISGNNISDITTECSDKFSSNCKLCTKSYCIQCELSTCPIGQYAESKSCSCKNCSDIFSNCSECDSTKCTKCKDNNYYINKGKCENCPTNKICDGINAYDESYCTNPPAGYFCDGTTIKKCTDKYTSYCATCNSTKCLTCDKGYFLDGATCKTCSDGCWYCSSATKCTQCNAGRLLDSNNACTIFCSSLMDNCKECTDSSSCTSCNGGYYVNSSNKCSPCSDIANCMRCKSNSICTLCNSGYYVNSSNKCSKCTISNCALCDTDGTCLSCNQGYHASDDKKSCVANDDSFNCSDSSFMKIGNLCVTRKNMGDSPMLTIPLSVTTVNASGDTCYSQSVRCCWKGNTSTTCDSANGGYSGCTRTVCNYIAADEICSKFTYGGKTWRLPTKEEMEILGNYTIGLESNGLMFCDYAKNRQSAFCPSMYYCNGADKKECRPWVVWTASKNGIDYYYAALGEGVFSVLRINFNYYAASVRCVTEME